MMERAPMVTILSLTLPMPAVAQDEPTQTDSSGIPNAGAGILAEPGRFGLGLGGSSLASGVTGKIYLSPNLAVQANVGWWFSAGFSAGADILFERALWRNDDVSVQGYLGAGPSVGVFSVRNSATVLGASGVAGAGVHVAEVPIEVTLEIRPTIVVGSRFWNGFYFGGGGAVRYYF